MIRQTVPAYLHEIKHKLHPQAGGNLGNPSQPKASFPPWEENATILEVSPAVPGAGSKISSSHQLKNNEDPVIVILIIKAGEVRLQDMVLHVISPEWFIKQSLRLSRNN